MIAAKITALVMAAMFLVAQAEGCAANEQKMNEEEKGLPNDYNGETVVQCESRYCVAYVFDEKGAPLCSANIPQPEMRPAEFDVAAIPCPA